MTNFDDIRPDLGESFAWCFSHGRMHRFTADPWCTAEWVRLDGTSQVEAEADKVARFGGAVFLHHLPLEQQVKVDEEQQ